HLLEEGALGNGVSRDAAVVIHALPGRQREFDVVLFAPRLVLGRQIQLQRIAHVVDRDMEARTPQQEDRALEELPVEAFRRGVQAAVDSRQADGYLAEAFHRTRPAPRADAV